jgi:hypothetical protein
LSSYFAVNVPDLTKREFVILISLVVPTILFGLYPAPILDGLHYSVSTLIYASSEYTGLSTSFIPLAFTTKRFSSKTSKPLFSETTNQHPQFITGFVDAEGCWLIKIEKYPQYTSGYRVQLRFSITLHKKDLKLLNSIKTFFGVGLIYEAKGDTIIYQVTTLNDLQILINHFNKYPLVSKKRADYDLLKQAFELVSREEHLTVSGLHLLLAIKASLNRGLSPELTSAFPNIIPVERSLVNDQKVQDPHWLAGFVSGDGCFFISISKATTSIGYSVALKFQVTQHSRDTGLIKSLVSYFDCGQCYIPKGYNHIDFLVRKTSDIYTKIIPFFNEYPLQGVKAEDFVDFCKVADIKKSKGHLIMEGLEEIRKIKEGMNLGRYANQKESVNNKVFLSHL